MTDTPSGHERCETSATTSHAARVGVITYAAQQ